jgi:hypothetical protein
MALKVVHDYYFDSSVAAGATDLQLSPVIAVGKTVKIINFGGFDPNIGDSKDGIIALQWGSGTTWKTIRAGGGATFDFKMDKDFVGDGVSRFRLARQNKSASAKPLIVWLYAVVL